MAFSPRLPHISVKSGVAINKAFYCDLCAAMNELACWLASVSQSTQSAQLWCISWVMFRIGILLEGY